MKKHIALFSLVAVALVAVPVTSRAQNMILTNSPPPAAVPKNIRQPFGGVVTAADAGTMSMTVSGKMLTVTRDTRIYKDGKPGTFADIIVGDMANGSYRQDADGNLIAITVRMGETGDKKDMKKAGVADQPPSIPNGS